MTSKPMTTAIHLENLLERIEALEAENHDARLRLPQQLRERWWATYNAVLPALLSLSPDYHTAREHARLIADAEHGKVPSVRFGDTP